MHAYAPDGRALQGTNVVSEASQIIRLWCTAAVTTGDWISEFTSDTTNPAGLAGESFRTAVSSNADALMGTCGVAAETTTGAGFAMVQIRGRVSGANVTSSAAVAIGDDLVIGSSAGRAVEYADATTYNLRLIGRCLSTPSGNTADVELYVHPRFAE